MKGKDILVLAPNKLFLDYISDILPSLGANEVRQNTFEELIMSKLKIKGKIYNKDAKLKDIMNEKKKSSQKKRGATVAAVLCFVAAIAIAGIVPRISASSEIVGSFPNMVTVSPTLASTPVMSSIHISIQMLPMLGTLFPLSRKEARPRPRWRSSPSA